MPRLNPCSTVFVLSVCALAAWAPVAKASDAEGPGAQGPVTQTLGTCAWSHVPAADRAAILGDYHQASVEGILAHMPDFSRGLEARDEILHQAFLACDSRPDIPRHLYSSLLAAQAIQSGAAAELDAAHLTFRPHISRDKLDDAWSEAPEASRQCVRAHVGKDFGVTDLTCPDLKPTFWFLRKFGLNPYIKSDQPVAAQILIFYAAKAQDEFAVAAIAHMEKGAADAPAP